MTENKREDPRIARTKSLLRESLMALIREKDIRKISISEITDQAGVARPTFYLHYETKEALLLDIFDEIFGREYEAYFAGWKEEQSEEFRIASVTKALQKYKEYSYLIQAIFQAGLGEVFDKNTEKIIRRHLQNLMELRKVKLDPQAFDIAAQNFAGSFSSVLTEWLISGAEMDPKFVATVYLRLAGEGYDFLFENHAI